MKKTIALVLAVLMVFALAACAKTPASSAAPAPSSAAPAESKPESKEENKISYPLKDGGTLSLAWGDMTGNTGGKPWKDTMFIQALQEQTGIKLEINAPQDFNVYFAGQNYDDMIYSSWSGYPGGASKAIADNIIIPIEDYLEANAPDYLNTLAQDASWNKMATTPDGHKYGFNFIRTDKVLQIYRGLIVREDWLKDLGMELPETPEEFKAMLVAFRDQKGATAPFSQDFKTLRAGTANQGMIAGAFGLPAAIEYVDGATVKYGAYEDAYKDYLAYMNDLYKEGLIDKNFMTLDGAAVTANILGGVSGVAIGALGGGIGNWMQAAEKSGDTKFALTGITPLVAKKGDTAIGGQYENPVLGAAAAISSQCKNAELACQFLNYGYTEDGHNLWNFGIEGVSWNYTKDNELYTHEYTKLAFATDDLTKSQSLYQYCCVGMGPFGQDQDYIWQNNDRPQQRNALSGWMKTDVAKYALPPLTVAEDKVDEYSQLSTEVGTYVSEMTGKFITGEKSLDEFANYQAELKKMGIEDYIAIVQAAYDEYNSRK